MEKTPGNNGIGKKIKNLGLSYAVIAGISAGVQTAHKNNQIEERTKIETSFKQNEANKLEQVPIWYLEKYIEDDFSYEQTKVFFQDVVNNNRKVIKSVEDFDKREKLEIELQGKLVERAVSKEERKDLIDSHLITDRALNKTLLEEYND